MLEKLLLAMILTLSWYCRYQLVQSNQMLTQMHQNTPQLSSSVLTSIHSNHR